MKSFDFATVTIQIIFIKLALFSLESVRPCDYFYCPSHDSVVQTISSSLQNDFFKFNSDHFFVELSFFFLFSLKY